MVIYMEMRERERGGGREGSSERERERGGVDDREIYKFSGRNKQIDSCLLRKEKEFLEPGVMFRCLEKK